ncbi:unnamed protein product [Schistocephalus solidus]|uniref:Protein kinase domain-containing protein n=1 Tax=Schistocephalus solidus TaxID=70667 RepID=A0A183SK09_SCHSO|nr:unnamed protein product [Schistocephalus solidus]
MDADEEFPCDVEQRDTYVVITEMPVPLPFVQMEDDRVFELLRNLSLALHLLEECCEFHHEPGPVVLVNFPWDCVRSRCPTAASLLHGPDVFW